MFKINIKTVILICTLSCSLLYEMREVLLGNATDWVKKINFGILCLFNLSLLVQMICTKQIKLAYILMLLWMVFLGIVCQNDPRLIILDLFSFMPFLIGLAAGKSNIKALKSFFSISLIIACGLVLTDQQNIKDQFVRNLHDFSFSNFASGILLLSPILIIQDADKKNLETGFFVFLNLISLHCNILLGNRLGSGLNIICFCIFLLFNFWRNLYIMIFAACSLLTFFFTSNNSIIFERLFERFGIHNFSEKNFSNERFYEIELAWTELSEKEKLFGRGFGGTVFKESPLYVEKGFKDVVYKAHSMYVVMLNQYGEVKGKLLLHSFFGTLAIKGGVLIIVCIIISQAQKIFKILANQKTRFRMAINSNSLIVVIYLFACLLGLTPNYSYPLSTFFLGVLFSKPSSETKNLK